MSGFSKFFAKFATAVSKWTGRPIVFVSCGVLVILWAVSGPLFGFSDTWQLVINTSTTIITFLMVFLIQNTQNRDNNALHAKLDELIRVSSGHNGFIGIENLPDEELEAILAECDKNSPQLRLEALKEDRRRSSPAAAAAADKAEPPAKTKAQAKPKAKPRRAAPARRTTKAA